MAKAPKKRGGQRVSQTPKGSRQLDDLNYWRHQAEMTNPEVKDPFELGEIALALRGVAKQLATHWDKFSRIVNKADDKSGALGLSIQIDRRTEPADTAVKSSYSEKYGSTVQAKVPDPKVMELPFGQDKDDDDQDPEPTASQDGGTQLGLQGQD